MRYLALALLAGGLLVVGCDTGTDTAPPPKDTVPKEQPKGEPSKPPPQPSALAQDPGKDIEKVKDPVCGMMVETKGALTTKHEGKDYYFCKEDCLKKFQENPQKYIPVPPKPGEPERPPDKPLPPPLR